MLVDKDIKDGVKQKPKQLYQAVESIGHAPQTSEEYHKATLDVLQQSDIDVYRLITQEYERLQNSLQLIAAENLCSRAVLAALGSVVQNKTTEGFVGARWHGGCEVVDRIEILAVERACQAFGAQYANVQPHSGSTANQIVFKALLKPGDTILSLDAGHGGHPSHGGGDSLAREIYRVESYGVEPTSFVFDYEKILAKAKEIQPRLIMCGASAYPRIIDFKRFRIIADEVGAYLLADISHIAGQVISGVHPSSINVAHVTTTSTYKAGGPRGGLILSGNDYQMPIETASGKIPLSEALNRSTFPGLQGTPYFNNIAAKAVFFKETLSDTYRQRQLKVVENAKVLAHNLIASGFDVLTGGTDNHMILVDICRSEPGLNGIIAQRVFEDCGIVTDSYRLPYQRLDIPPGGLRLGTPIVTVRRMGAEQMKTIAAFAKAVLGNVQATGPDSFEINASVTAQIKQQVAHFCNEFPLG